MKEQLSLLIELQKAESEIHKINVKCLSLPEELSKLEEGFSDFLAGAEEQRKKFEDLQKVHREKEEKLRKGQELVKRGKDRLNEVKTNKEYQAVLKENEGIERKNSETEDEIISLLEAVDSAREELKAREKGMESYKQAYEKTKTKLESELRTLDVVLSSCRQKSDEIKTHISADLLKRYEAIKVLHNKLAVVSVWKEICEGCYMNIPPQLYIELQRAVDLHMCPNCNRIIYWYDQSEGKK